MQGYSSVCCDLFSLSIGGSLFSFLRRICISVESKPNILSMLLLAGRGSTFLVGASVAKEIPFLEGGVSK